jgi:hypothetical protein
LTKIICGPDGDLNELKKKLKGSFDGGGGGGDDANLQIENAGDNYDGGGGRKER